MTNITRKQIKKFQGDVETAVVNRARASKSSINDDDFTRGMQATVQNEFKKFFAEIFGDEN